MPKHASKSARPAGAMAVVVNAIGASGLKTDPDHLSSAVMPKMDMGVLHAHDGTVTDDRPVPVQRITAVRPLHSCVTSLSVRRKRRCLICSPDSLIRRARRIARIFPMVACARA